MQHVEVGIPQMNRRSFVAVKVKQGSGIAGALVLEIKRVWRRSRNQRDEWINALERVIHHQATLGNYVMPAPGGAAE